MIDSTIVDHCHLSSCFKFTFLMFINPFTRHETEVYNRHQTKTYIHYRGLCLKLRQGFALYPQWVSPLDPDQGRVPGPFARFARCFILLYACNLLWSAMLIPHFSFLIPHSSLLTPHLTPLLI